MALESAESVEYVLSRYAVHPSQLKPFSMGSDLELVEKHFTQNSVEDILESLKSDDSDFAQNCLRTMDTVSPTALKIVYAAFKKGRNLSLKQCLEMEFKIITECMKQHDFMEGVRAVLVDRDNYQQSKKAAITDGSDSTIEKYVV